jgi:hypothetical protein
MENLTSEIKKILDTPDEQINVSETAVLLLKINRNRILHENIIRRNNVGKLKYELQKIYDFRMKENALKETSALEKEATIIVKETFPKVEIMEASETKGMRADHEQLPDEIKAKYQENLTVFPRMRKLHEQLKLMGNAKPCDRYPFLKELKELDEKLRQNWDEYDAYKILPADDEPSAPDGNPSSGNENPEPVDVKKISAARKYLSDNKPKLTELKELEDQTKYGALLAKMQERLTVLIQTNAGISDEQLAELKALGLNA